MRGRVGTGVFGARGSVAAASALLVVAAVATAPSSGADPGGQAARGHAPKVKITHGPPSRTSSHKATFKFKSDKKKTKFKCKLDGGSYQKCSSPRKVHVGRGKHTFSVYGTNLGVPGPVASRKWKVTGKSANPRHHLAQNFVFNGGPGAPLNGLVISGLGPAGCAEPFYCLVKEDTLGADGAVIGAGPYPDCNAEYHYHGFLFEESDQPFGCGWGTVTPFGTDESSVVRATAIAITLETAASNLDQPKSARQQLTVGMQQLDSAAQNPALDPGNAAKLTQASQLDVQADGLLGKAASVKGKQRKKKVKKARRLLDQALALKRQVWDALAYPQ
jgi:hypothetical protein